MPFLSAKADLSLAYNDSWTQVDVNASVANSPDEATLQLEFEGNQTIHLRSATGGIEIAVGNIARASSLKSIQQVTVPLNGNRYFEYKIEGTGSAIAGYLIAHNGTA